MMRTFLRNEYKNYKIVARNHINKSKRRDNYETVGVNQVNSK